MFQTLIPQIKEYKKPSILASVFMTLEVMFEIPFPLSWLIFWTKVSSNPTCLTFGSTVASCQSAPFYHYSAACSRLAMQLLPLLDLPRIYVRPFSKRFKPSLLKILIKFSAGGLVTRMMTDVTNVQNSYQMIIRICVRAPLNLIFAITASFLINGEMAWIFVGVTLFLGLVLAIITKSYILFLLKYLRLMTTLTTVSRKISPTCVW